MIIYRRVSNGKADRLYRLLVSDAGRRWRMYTQLFNLGRLREMAKEFKHARIVG